MARFDLLDEYTCLVVPERLQIRASGEMARRKTSLDIRYARASWMYAVDMIVKLGVLLTRPRRGHAAYLVRMGPYHFQADLEHMREGMRKAGLPE